MRKREMTLEQAQDILAHIVSQRVRWGVQYDGGEIGLDKMMDAIVMLGQHENNELAELKEALTKANRQLAAANARETKLRNQIEELKNVE